MTSTWAGTGENRQAPRTTPTKQALRAKHNVRGEESSARRELAGVLTSPVHSQTAHNQLAGGVANAGVGSSSQAREPPR